MTGALVTCRCGLTLPEQHTALVGDERRCPSCVVLWARGAAQQDAVARALGRPCGDADGGPVRYRREDVERPRSGTEG